MVHTVFIILFSIDASAQISIYYASIYKVRCFPKKNIFLVSQKSLQNSNPNWVILLCPPERPKLMNIQKKSGSCHRSLCPKLDNVQNSTPKKKSWIQKKKLTCFRNGNFSSISNAILCTNCCPQPCDIQYFFFETQKGTPSKNGHDLRQRAAVLNTFLVRNPIHP